MTEDQPRSGCLAAVAAVGIEALATVALAIVFAAAWLLLERGGCL